jgi:ribosomal-protein-alanine N-acetyltransferase
MKLRYAAAEDAEALADVHAKAFDAAWTAPDIARLMMIMGGFALIAETDGIVGFILARAVGGEAEILTLAVAPWARRQGVGAALVEAVAARAAAEGAKAVFLEVAADNETAVGVYLRAGFQQAGLRRGYYARPDARPVDALVLRRTLNSPSR